jgi:hypothetical protein
MHKQQDRESPNAVREQNKLLSIKMTEHFTPSELSIFHKQRLNLQLSTTITALTNLINIVIINITVVESNVVVLVFTCFFIDFG